MAKLETLSKDKFDELPDAVKEYYVQNRDGLYEPDGVGSLKRAVEAEKQGKQKAIDDAVAKAVADALKPFEGIDPEKSREMLTAAEKAAEAKLKDAGDYDALKQSYEDRISKLEQGYEDRLGKLEAKYKAELETATGENAATLSTLKRERLANILTEKGVLPDRVKYVVHEMDNDTELIRDDNGFDVRKKGGIGDATEFEGMIENMKTKSPFFFAADNTPGSGASGSDGKGSNGAKTMTRAAFDRLSATEKHQAAVVNKVQITD